MSFFPYSDPAKLHAALAQTYTIYNPSSPSSPTTSLRRQRAMQHAASQWSIPSSSSADCYPSSSQSMTWTSGEPRGLGLLTSSEGLYGGSSTVTTSKIDDPSMSWTANAGLVSPAMGISRKDSAIGHCNPLSTLLPGASVWNSISSGDASMLSVDETSPGRSEYSNSSSQHSVGSSPYTQPDGSYASSRSPPIKTEDAGDIATDGYPYIPASMALDRPIPVNAGGLMGSTSMPVTVEEEKRLFATSSQSQIKSDYTVDDYGADESQSQTRVDYSVEDYAADESQQRSRASSYVSSDSGLGEYRAQKRSFTTAANSTCKCDICGKMFQRSYNLKAHMETHDPNREQPHECPRPNCRRKFVRRTDLVRHDLSVHEKLRVHQCPLCDAAFARKDTLRRHVEDGCPRRYEVKKRVSKPNNGRARSNSRSSSSPAYHRNTPSIPSYTVYGQASMQEPYDHLS